jgi:Nucleotide-diphospho-sugar transferase
MAAGHPSLPTETAEALSTALAARMEPAEPLPVVFATGSFAALLENWLIHARTVGVRQVLVIAMDERLAFPTQADVLAVRHRYDGTLHDLWVQRALIFAFLAEQGVDFIHSDADAVWLKDPRPLCFADGDFDLVFSQGTNYPAAVWQIWGFVLCCGLFAVRANPATAAFFAQVRALAARIPDDQVAVNALLAQHRIVWDKAEHESITLRVRGMPFTAYRRMLPGTCEALSLRVGMIPHDRVPRLPIAEADAVVRHPLGPGDPVLKADVLRSVGCWKLP